METKRIAMLAIMLSFLIFAAFDKIGKSVVYSPNHNYHVSYALDLTLVTPPKNVMPQSLGCCHTTNPHKDWYKGDPLQEVPISEGGVPYHVVLALDEEALQKWGIDYSERVIERADEAFVADFSKDLQITEAITYVSDNVIEWMSSDNGNPSLYEEAFNLFKDRFNNGAEFLIVVTGQETYDSYIVGLAPAFALMGVNTMVMVRFQVYFADDNVVQHEVAHCFGCDDHDETVDIWCNMAYKTELLYVDWVEEDGNWFGPYISNVGRAYLYYDYCAACNTIISSPAGNGGGNPMRLRPSPL